VDRLRVGVLLGALGEGGERLDGAVLVLEVEERGPDVEPLALQVNHVIITIAGTRNVREASHASQLSETESAAAWHGRRTWGRGGRGGSREADRDMTTHDAT
jgi:hypothetical protein